MLLIGGFRQDDVSGYEEWRSSIWQGISTSIPLFTHLWTNAIIVAGAWCLHHKNPMYLVKNSVLMLANIL